MSSMATSRLISNTKGQGRGRFDVGLDWKKEEERTCSGCVSRKERKERKRQIKMADEAEEQNIRRQMAYAFRDLKEVRSEQRLLRVYNDSGGDDGAFGLQLNGFLRAAGAPEDFRQEFCFASNPQPSSSDDESLRPDPLDPAVNRRHLRRVFRGNPAGGDFVLEYLDIVDSRSSEIGEHRAEHVMVNEADAAEVVVNEADAAGVVVNEADAAGVGNASAPSDRDNAVTEQDDTKTAAAPTNPGAEVISIAAFASAAGAGAGAFASAAAAAAGAGASDQEDTMTEQDGMKEAAVENESMAKKQKTVG